MGQVVSLHASMTPAPAASTLRPLDELFQNLQEQQDLQNAPALGGMFTGAIAEMINDADEFSVSTCFAQTQLSLGNRNFLRFPLAPRTEGSIVLADRHSNEVFKGLWETTAGSSQFRELRTKYQGQKPELFANHFGPLADILMAHLGTITTSIDEIKSGVMSRGTSDSLRIVQDVAAFLALDRAAPEVFWKNTLVFFERKTLFETLEGLANAGLPDIKRRFIPQRLEAEISGLVLNANTGDGAMNIYEVGLSTLQDAMTHLDVLTAETKLRLMRPDEESFGDLVEETVAIGTPTLLQRIGDLTVELSKRVGSYIPALLDDRKDASMAEDLAVLLNLFDFLGRSPAASEYMVYHSLSHADRTVLAHTLFHLNDLGFGYESPLQTFKHLLRPMRQQKRENVGSSEEVTINTILFDDPKNVLFALAKKTLAENLDRGILRPSELLRLVVVKLAQELTHSKDLIKAKQFEELVRKFSATENLKNLLWWSLSDEDQELFRKALFRGSALDPNNRLVLYSQWSRFWLHVPRETTRDETMGLTAAFGPIARSFDEISEYIKYGRVGVAHPLPIGNTGFTLSVTPTKNRDGYTFNLEVPDPESFSWQDDSLFDWMRHLSQFSLYTKIVAERTPGSTAFYNLTDTTYSWLLNIYHESMVQFYEWQTEAFRVLGGDSILKGEISELLRYGRTLLERLNRFNIYLRPLTLELASMVTDRINLARQTLEQNHMNQVQRAKVVSLLKKSEEYATILSSARTQFHNIVPFRTKLDGIHEVIADGDFEAATFLVTPKPARLDYIFEGALDLAIGKAKDPRFRVIGDTKLLSGLSVEAIGYEHALLLQVLVEFMHNFSKYYDPDKEDSSATFTVTKSGDELKFHYRDTGIGMQESTIDKIFAGAVGVREGTTNKKGYGHGLAGQIILIQELGGRFPREEFHAISKETDPEHSGIEFTFYIPMDKFQEI